MGDVTENFSNWEFQCKCGCGGTVERSFIEKCQRVRDRASELAGHDVSMPVNSGYRCPAHDKNVGGAGVHPQRRAADFRVSRQDAFYVTKAAMEEGFTGFGFKQKGPSRFIHLDDLPDHPRPNIWSY